MKNVILTGSTGFVGANIARRLLRDGHTVHVLVRESHKDWRLKGIKKDLSFHFVDFADQKKLTTLFKRIHPDWIFHTAVYGAYSHQADLDQSIQTNVVGFANLLQAALASGFESFVNTGSSSEYGYKDHAPKEDEVVDPNSYYAITKVAATHLAHFIANTHEVYIPTLRLYSVYGPYEEPTRLLPALLRAGMRGTYPPLAGPTIARDYVYIDDVIEAYMLAAKMKQKEYGAIYNVGTQKQTTLKELVEITKKKFQIPGEPQWGSMPNRSWDTSTWVSTTQKIKKDLGWKPAFTVEQGIDAMNGWMKEYNGKEYL
jgi:UDP-glucose 4-epimerase